MTHKLYTGFIFLIFLATSCSKTDNKDTAPPGPTPADSIYAPVVVDCSEQQGPVMRVEKDNGTSTTSLIPGEKTKTWLQGMDHHLVRVWIQLRYVYNKGNIDYNYRYSNSNVGVEDALAFYSQTADSLLVALTAYNSTTTWPLPQGEDLKDFIKKILIHYKKKFPKIKYITVGNEPDHAGETMATYYPIYQRYYEAVNEVNDSLQLQDHRILISNGAITGNITKMLNYADGFLKAYAADKNPDKKLDFFSFNSYGEANRPLELLQAGKKIDSAMQSNGLPAIPTFITEYGIVGGSGLPSGTTLSETITMQPAGQLTKAFYLYEGGINEIFNWCIHHGSIEYKSEVADIDKGFRSPYGNALSFCKEISDRGTRIKGASDRIDHLGLGIHVLASMDAGKGIAVLVWNYNWRNKVPDQKINVLIKNIPESIFKDKKMQQTVYLIDGTHNNYDYDKSQNSLKASIKGITDYKPYEMIPLTLERSAVALILLTPQ